MNMFLCKVMVMVVIFSITHWLMELYLLSEGTDSSFVVCWKMYIVSCLKYRIALWMSTLASAIKSPSFVVAITGGFTDFVSRWSMLCSSWFTDSDWKFAGFVLKVYWFYWFGSWVYWFYRFWWMGLTVNSVFKGLGFQRQWDAWWCECALALCAAAK